MLTESEWENLCDNCGACCEITCKIACPFLDVGSCKCTDYENRFKNNAVCAKVTPDNVLVLHKEGLLPDTCAYVHWKKGTQPPKEVEKAHLLPFRIMSQAFKVRVEATMKGVPLISDTQKKDNRNTGE